MFKYLCVFFILLLPVAAQVAEVQKPVSGKMIKVFPQDKNLLPYWLYLPQDYGNTEKKYPVVLFLHGLGERGDTLNAVAKHGITKEIKKGKHFPFIMIAPQCANDGSRQNKEAQSFWWRDGPIHKVKNILDFEIKRLKRVDEERVSITGLSMGGFGSYRMAHLYPSIFAAVAPICGHGNSFLDKKEVAHIPFWAFHGDKDNVIKLADQQKTVDAMKKAGVQIKFTIYEGVGHNSWSRAYANPEIYKWLLDQKRVKRD